MARLAVLNIISIALALSACDSKSEEESTDDGEGMTSGMDSGEEFVNEDHGFVKLRLVTGADTPEDWYAGSLNFSVNLQYDACLMQFYQEHPSWRANGENGGPIFTDWQNMLCSVDVPDRVNCTIEAIAQEFSAVSQLLVRFEPDSVEALPDAVVAVGPIPTETMAGCVPIVRLEAGAVVGTQDIGEKVWEGVSFSSNTATTDQDEVIDVEVIRFFE